MGANGTAGAQPAVKDVGPDSARAVELGGHVGIGSALEAARRELLASGQVLGEVLEPAGVGLSREAVRLLEQQACRVAVVGQIKAGKSSFINALVQQPGLLPTDINPWTTAVTTLHYGKKSDTEDAAIFNFFTPQEWERLAEGGGKLRELTERLVPGFEPALLRQHITAVRARASARLGSQFQELLGQSHRFRDLDRRTLVQYVCAGEPGQPSEIGKYSDITRSADIYLTKGPFDFPVSVIDTPGTNDPFLIRDEITRSSLDKADVYIIVLTAHQPLSDADVSLLRILRGLHKERLIVYINRIDELADVARDSSEVVNFVRKRLAYELPGFDIPIIAGSAAWGNAVLGGAKVDVDKAQALRALAYCQDAGLLRRGDILRPAQEGTVVQPPLQQALFAGSGLPRVYAALNELVTTSHCAYVVRHVAHCFAEMARGSEASIRAELDGLASIHEQAKATADRTVVELDRLRAEQRDLEESARIIDQSARDFEKQLADIVRRDVDRLRERLTAFVDQQAHEERDALVSVLLAGKAPKVWACDTASLRRRMGEEVVGSFRATEHVLSELSFKVMSELRRLTALLMPESAPPAEPDAPTDIAPPPSLMPLGSYVALDLDVSWWSQLWRAKPTPNQRGEAIEKLVKSEFYPVVDELVQSIEQVFDGFIKTTTRWSFAVCRNIVQVLTRRHEQLIAHYSTVQGGVDGCADPETVRQQAELIVQLRSRLALASGTAQRLTALNQTIDRWFVS
jgi:hypothetical protein